VDDDGDAIPDGGDNCPAHFNLSQDDLDNDGHGDACDEDDDGDQVADPMDCEPLNPEVFPGNYEQCDGADNDCDGAADEGKTCEAGCADGVREGFVDIEVWPQIAACAGSFQGPVFGPSAGEVCQVGWHVCSPADNPGDAAFLKMVSFEDATAFGGCFAINAAQDQGECQACTGEANGDDMAGVGSGCSNYHPDESGCIGDGRLDVICCEDHATQKACHFKPGLTDGVVCCRSP